MNNYPTTPPNYIFWSNMCDGIIPVTSAEDCLKRALETFPNVPREAILVVENTVLRSGYSIFIAAEFKPEIDRFMRELAVKMEILEIMTTLENLRDTRFRFPNSY